MKIRFTILNKLLGLLLLVTIVPLCVLGYLSIKDITSMQISAKNHVDAMGFTAIEDSTSALNKIGEEMIKQKALDVAKQVEIYLKSNPDKTILDLQNDDYFQSIAVQPVGETGYTALTDVITLTCRFHISEKLVDLDLYSLAVDLPGFWSVMSKTQGGQVSDGYYDWLESDGSLKKKYMYISIVNATTADGVILSVAATTYIDEFNAPVKKTSLKIERDKINMISSIELTGAMIKYHTLMLVIITSLIAFILGIIFATSITFPLRKLTIAGVQIADGQLDTEVPVIKSRDEIEDLSDAVNLMTGAIKFFQKEQHIKTKPVKQKNPQKKSKVQKKSNKSKKIIKHKKNKK